MGTMMSLNKTIGTNVYEWRSHFLRSNFTQILNAQSFFAYECSLIYALHH